MKTSNTVSSPDCSPSVCVPILEKTVLPFSADRIDKIFAWLYFLLGFGFIYTFTSAEMERNIHVFTLSYAAFVLLYLYFKKNKLSKEGIFWLVILCGLGLSFSWSGIIFPLFQILVLIITAAYFTVCAGSALLCKGESSQWIVLDGFNTMILIPFSNFLCHIKVLKFHSDTEQTHTAFSRLRSILLGLVISIPILLVALPLLGSADQQFANILDKIAGFLQDGFFTFLFRLLFSLPVTAYLFGLIYGTIHKRNTEHFSKLQTQKTAAELRLIPNLAVHTALFTVCTVYLLFILMQGSYLFSAFSGTRPDTYTYAEYARRGFFELCQVAVWNLAILLGANCFSKISRMESNVLRIMNLILSILTLLLIATAMSKMLLYISAYGLTEKRVLTMVFMAWLFFVFILVLLWQFKPIAIVRISFLTGVCLYTLLCILPVWNWIIDYNRLFFPELLNY